MVEAQVHGLAERGRHAIDDDVRAGRLRLVLAYGGDALDSGDARHLPADVGRDGVEAGLGGHDVVGADGLLVRAARRRPEAAEHRGAQRDEGETDHERGRGGGGPRRVARRVAAGQPAGGAAEAPCGGAHDRREWPHQAAGDHDHAEAEPQGAETDEDHRLAQGAHADRAGERECRADHDNRHRDRRPAGAEPGREDRSLTQGVDRCDPGGPPGRREAGDQGDDDAQRERHDDRAGFDHGRCLREVDTERLKEAVEALREREAAYEADDRGEHPHDQALGQHRALDLAARSAERSQGGELAEALGERDRQRVEDHERAHAESDEPEPEQEVLDELVVGLNVLRIRVGLLLTALDLSGGRHVGPQSTHELLVGDALAGRDEDRVVLPALAQQSLRGADVEDGERRAADRVLLAVLGHARDRELARWAVGGDADLVADAVSVVLGRALVDDDLPRA